MGKYFVYLIALVLIAAGGRLLVPPYSAPDRNVEGDASEETLVSQCEAGTPAWTIRLYEGSAALIGSWQSVTAARPGSDERQWFYSLLKPHLKSVQCKGDVIELYGATGLLGSIPAQELAHQTRSPTVYIRGKEAKRDWDGIKPDHTSETALKIAGGALLILLGGITAWITSRVAGGRARLS